MTNRPFLASTAWIGAAFLLVSCGGGESVGPGSTFDFSVLPKDTTFLVGQGANYTVDAVGGTPEGVTITYSSSTPSVLSITPGGAASAVGVGTSTVTATAKAPGLPPAGVRKTTAVTVGFAGIKVTTPNDSLTGLGETRVLTAVGTDINGVTVTGGFTPAWQSSVTTVASVSGAVLTAAGNGITFVKATYGGLSDSVLIKVRQVAKSITFPAPAPPFTLRAVARDSVVPVVVRDTRDAIIAAPAAAWISNSPGALTVTPTGTARALTTAGGQLQVTVDTVTRLLSVTVSQLPVTIQPCGGDQQTGVVGASLLTPLCVEIRDAGNSPDSGVAVTFAVTLGGGGLSAATVVTNAQGQASVNWTLGTLAGSQSVTVSVAGLPATVPFSATATPGPVATLTFCTQPGAAGTGVLLPTTAVCLFDQYGNPATNATTSVTVAFGTNPSSATLSGTKTVPANSGKASFTTLAVDNAGVGYTLTASVPVSGVANVGSGAFTIFGPPAQLAIVVQPATSAAGQNIAPAIQVEVRDAAGSVITTGNQLVTIALGNNPGGATLLGTLQATASAGVASFNAVSLDRVGAGYTLVASSGALTTATTAPFNITVGTPSRLQFTVQPTSAGPGIVIAPTVKVAITDAFGNIATSRSDQLTLALTTPAGATLTGGGATAAVLGVASFGSLAVSIPGNYTLTASPVIPGLTSIASAQFSILTPGAPDHVRFVVQPSDVVAGSSMSPSVQVVILDNQNITVPGTSNSVTLVLGNAAGATLFGQTTLNALNGVATFPGLNIDKAGTGYTLTASSTALTSDVSTTFKVSAGGASKLAFTVQPISVAAGQVMAPAVQVSITDNQGNLISTATNQIALTVGINPTGAGLSGTLQQNAAGGVATFDDLILDAGGNGFTFSAAATSLQGAASAAFNVTTGLATKLSFKVQPANSSAGVVINPAVQVAIQDANGFTVPSATGPVALAFAANPSSGILSGTVSVAAVNGVATFNDLSVDKAGGGYTVAASAASLAGVTSTQFSIAAGPASTLAFKVEPVTTPVQSVITPHVQVEVRDAGGNPVSSYSGAVNIQLWSGPVGAVLGGTSPVTAVNGVATFTDLTLNKAGTGVILFAFANGLGNAFSAPFDITALAPARVEFLSQPSNFTLPGGGTFVQVAIRDQLGNVVTSATDQVTLSLRNNPVGATLSGDVVANAANGIATFSTTTLDLPGQGFTLRADATGLAADTSTVFNVVGPATQLVYTTEPSTTIRNGIISPTVVVELRDAAGSRVNSFAQVTIAIGANPGGGTLAGSTTVTAQSGVASFSNLSLNQTGTGYTLVANSSGLPQVTSQTFNINAFGPAAKLGFVVQPINAVVNTAITPAVQVAVQDASGNTVTSGAGANSSITLALGANPGGGALGGTLILNAVNGIASFSGLTLNAIGTGYTLTAAASTLAGAASSPFAIVASPTSPIKLAFTVQPTGTQAGNLLSSVKVAVEDANGAIVTGSVVSVTLSVSGTNLSYTSNTSSGEATFSAIQLTAARSYQLLATAVNLTSATSQAFTITPTIASQLQVIRDAKSTIAGNIIADTVILGVVDQYGNVVTTASSVITLDPWTTVLGPGLIGTLTRAASQGIAKFTGLRARYVGQYIYATAPGLGVGTGAASFVLPAPSHALAWTAWFPGFCGNAPYSPAIGSCAPVKNVPFYGPGAAVIDSIGNRTNVGQFAVSLTLINNTTGAVLSGLTSGLTSGGSITFSSTLSIDQAGTGYAIGLSSPGLVSGATAAFDVQPAFTLAGISFTVQPSNTQSGQVITPNVEVSFVDAFGNVVTSTSGNITIGLGAGSGTPGGTLVLPTTNGVARFTDLSVTGTGTGFSLTAISDVGSFAGIPFDSAPFDISP